jgi:DNA-binding response OmpR family regulator
VRILAIDDDPDLLALCRINLTLDGHEVVEASSGREGLDLVASCQPDIVLLDVMMPRLDGLDVLRAIRAGATSYDLPVVIVSARVGHEAESAGRVAGADAYVTKPFSPDLLLDTLKQALEQRKDHLKSVDLESHS